MGNPGLVGPYCVHYRAFLTYKLGAWPPQWTSSAPSQCCWPPSNTVIQTIYTQDTLALGSEKCKKGPQLFQTPQSTFLKICSDTWGFIIGLSLQRITSISKTNIKQATLFWLTGYSLYRYGKKGEMMRLTLSVPTAQLTLPMLRLELDYPLPTFYGFRFNLACSFYTCIQ